MSAMFARVGQGNAGELCYITQILFSAIHQKTKRKSNEKDSSFSGYVCIGVFNGLLYAFSSSCFRENDRQRRNYLCQGRLAGTY